MRAGKKPDVSLKNGKNGDGSGKRRNTINSVVQALNALDYLGTCGGEAGVVEVSEALGVHKSTASRVLATMSYQGYVARNETTQKYSLGIRIVELARAKLEQFELREFARPFLEKLSRETEETIHLAVLDQKELVYIDKVDSPFTLSMRSSVGAKIPLHCTALGKAILSGLNQTGKDALLGQEELNGFTPNTITDREQLREHLDFVRSRGFAIDDQEHEEGIRCVASVVWDYNEEIAGAISISGPALRMSEQRTDKLGRLVKEVCKELSKSLGSSGGSGSFS